MSQEYKFDDKEQFLEKLEELVKSGKTVRDLSLYFPFPIHEVDNILMKKPSNLRFFTLLGALSGGLFGLFFTIWTSLNYPLIGGGKPIVSIPAFIIVTFELTILFGGVISFIGFLILSRLPSVNKIIDPEEHGNQFVIQIHGEGRK